MFKEDLMNLIPMIVWLKKALTTENLDVVEWIKEGFTDPKKYHKGMSWLE